MSRVKKKVFQKEKKKIKKLKAKSCKFHETKIFAYMSALLPFTAVSKLKQISESFSTNRHYNKRDSVHHVNLKQAIENWGLNCFFWKQVNICDWNVLSVEGMIFRIVTARILYAKENKKSRKLYLRKAIKFTYSLAVTWKVEHEGGSFVSYIR